MHHSVSLIASHALRFLSRLTRLYFSVSAKDMSKTTYPLIITPSHAVADLTLKDREKGYDQFLKALKGVPVEDDQCWAWNIDGEMAVDADRRW